MRRFLIAALLLVTPLVACSTPKSVALSEYQDQVVKWKACSSDMLLPADELSKMFDKNTATCAHIAVPAEYDTKSKFPDFSIAMLKIPATSANKLGTLFINPGGPGESGIKEAQWMDFPAEIHAKYDIIGFDPRGVNHSNPASGPPIKCSNRSDFETYWLSEGTPANAQEAKHNEDIMKAYLDKCSQANPAWWTLKTDNVVRDLDVMRGVLTGNAKLNFLGSSYGTTIAADYIGMFPQNSGHMILDSPTTSENQSDKDAITQAKAIEEKIIGYVDGYAKARNKTRAQVQALLLKIRQWGDDNKLSGFAGMKSRSVKNQTRYSDETLFTHGIFALTYYDDTTAQSYFNQGIDALLAPDHWNGMFEYFGFQLDGYDPESLRGAKYDPTKIVRDNSYEIMTMVNSMDRDDRDLTSVEHQKKLADQIAAAAPFWTALNSDASNYKWVPERSGSDWSWLAFDDKNIPDPPANMAPRINESGRQFLVVGSRHESTTPYPFSVQTAKDLKSSLVTFEGSEHAPLAGFTHECLNKIFVAYMLHDKLPAAGTTCKP
jgi:pimeloyl-ACP methyl ester carboxylesterase